MSKSSKVYWQDRVVEQEEIIFNQSIASYNKQLAKSYKEAMETIQVKLEALYDKIVDADGNIAINELYKFNRYYDVSNTINKELKKLGQSEVTLTNSKLTDMYAATAKVLEKNADLSFTIGNYSGAKNAVDAVWCSDGKHWSDRIWNNKDALQTRIEKGLVDCVSRGLPKDELVKQLRNDLNVGFRQADRIARTELTHVQTQATKDKYKEAGVQKYKFLAAHDSRTSDVCEKLDGKIFLLSEAKVGTNFPPMHPNCRSTILAVMESK